MYKLKSGIQVAYALGLPLVMAGSTNKEKLITQNEPSNQNCPEPGIFVKASQLPIYESIEDFNIYEYHGKEKGMLQDGISVIRKELDSALEITNEVRDNVSNIFKTGKAHTISSIEYLRDDENVAARVGAIATGGLLGLIFAIRRGFFKKLIYSSVGAGGTASVCYPKEAFELSQDVVYNAGDYAAIGYNFLVGVKPQSKDDFSDVKQQVKKLPVATPQVPRSIDSAAATTKVHEVRKPYSLEFLAQQASDVTWWGFRLKHYDGDNESEVSNQELAQSVTESLHGLIQMSSLDKLEVITKDAMAIIAAETVSEGAEKVNSVLHEISDMTENIKKISEKVEKLSNFVNNSAEFVQKEVEVIHEHPQIEKVTNEVEIISSTVGTLASGIDESAKFINTVDKSLIKIDEKIYTYTEEIVENKKDEIVEEVEDIIKQKIKDEQKRSFISQIFSLVQSKGKFQLRDESQKSIFGSDSEQLINDGSDIPLTPLGELEITNKNYVQTDKLCDNEQQSSFTLNSSELSSSESDDGNLLNMPIVVMPESQIISDKEKSDYENRMDQIEMLEDVFINAMLRMQKQENEAILKNKADKKENSNIDESNSSSFVTSNQDPSLTKHKINNEFFNSELSTNDVIQTNQYVVNTNAKAENDQAQFEMKMVETDDLRCIESPGRIFNIPDVMDIQLNQDTQLMASETDTAENKEKKPNEKLAKDVILKIEKVVKKKFEGDIGQSNPEDKDMYTTRG